MLEILLALLATATVGVLLIPLLRTPAATRGRFEGELGIYRDQLAEIERERVAGTLPENQAAAARLEVERRILGAADRAARRDADVPTGPPPDAVPASVLHKLLPPLLALAIPLFSLAVYLQLGQPGLPSAGTPRGVRPSAEPQLDIDRLVAAARQRVAAQPDDPAAQAALGEALTLEADGTVTEAALDAFRKAQRGDPDDPRTLYYLGLHEAQSGDSAAALARWRKLLASQPAATFAPMLRAEIERVARAAGLEADLPDAPRQAMPQPTRDQQEAMARLSPAEREQAIRGMVEGLAARLQDDPQDRAGWLRLANAWKVLGENGRAADAYARADALGPLEGRLLADWAEAQVRGLRPGEPPPPAAVAVLERLEKAEPRNALALFYLGAASFAAGDKPAARRRWQTLLSLLPPDAPIRSLLEQRIKETGAD